MAAARSSITPLLIRRMQSIRLAAFDVDGVMTDGTLSYADSGSERKHFHTLDGQGLKLLQQAGVHTAIITARESKALAQRASELAVGDVIQGCTDKQRALRELAQRVGLDLAQCAYMGDDLADLSTLQACGVAYSVAQAPLAIREHAHYVTRRNGGQGAVREVCDMLLRARRSRAH